MKWILRFFFAPILLVLFAVLGLGIFAYFTDLNDYKPMISEKFKAATGRELTLAGDIQVRVFPVFGIQIKDVSIGNPPGFEEKTFLTVGTVKVGIRVLPLLAQKVEVSEIIVDSPKIHVIKKKNGENNATFKLSTSSSQTPPTSVEPQAGEPATEAGSFSLKFDAITVKNADLTYSDLASDTQLKFHRLNLALPGLTPGEPIIADIDTGVEVLSKTFDAKLSLSGRGDFNPSSHVFSFETAKLQATLSGRNIPVPVNINVHSNVSLNTQEETIDATLKSIQLQIDDIMINGDATIKGPAKKPAIVFQAQSSAINLDQLQAKARKSAVKGEGNPPTGLPALETPIIPVAFLRTLNLNGDIKLAQLITSGLTLSDVAIKITAKDGGARVAPVTAKLYDGTLASDFYVDTRGITPAVVLQTKLTSVQVGPIIKARAGEDYVSGTGNADINIKMNGATATSLKNTAAGTVTFAFENGSINKWRLSAFINQAITFIKTKKIAPLTEDQFQFTSCTGTFQGANGIFRNDDLTIAGPKIHAFGNGAVNLVASTVDYTVQVGDGTPDRTAKHIPIRITGPLTAPNYRLDVQTVVEDTVREKVREKLLEKLDPEPTLETGEGTQAPATPKELGRELLKGLLR